MRFIDMVVGSVLVLCTLIYSLAVIFMPVGIVWLVLALKSAKGGLYASESTSNGVPQVIVFAAVSIAPLNASPWDALA